MLEEKEACTQPGRRSLSNPRRRVDETVGEPEKAGDHVVAQSGETGSAKAKTAADPPTASTAGGPRQDDLTRSYATKCRAEAVDPGSVGRIQYALTYFVR